LLFWPARAFAHALAPNMRRYPVRAATFSRELPAFGLTTADLKLALALDDRDLAYWDVADHSWRIEPGRFEIQVGHSSRDIRLRQSFELA